MGHPGWSNVWEGYGQGLTKANSQVGPLITVLGAGVTMGVSELEVPTWPHVLLAGGT